MVVFMSIPPSLRFGRSAGRSSIPTCYRYMYPHTLALPELACLRTIVLFIH
jgi:hypothetical protein